MSEINQTIIEHPDEAKDIIPKDWLPKVTREYDNYSFDPANDPNKEAAARFTTRDSSYYEHAPNYDFKRMACHAGLNTTTYRDTFLGTMFLKQYHQDITDMYEYLTDTKLSPWKECLNNSYILLKDKRPIMIFWAGDLKDLPAPLLGNFCVATRNHQMWGKGYIWKALCNAGFTQTEAFIISNMFNHSGGAYAKDTKDFFETSTFFNGIPINQSDAPFTFRCDGKYQMGPYFSPYHLINSNYEKSATLALVKGGRYQPSNKIWSRRNLDVIDKFGPAGGYKPHRFFYGVIEKYYKSGFDKLPEEFISEVKRVFNSAEELQLDP